MLLLPISNVLTLEVQPAAAKPTTQAIPANEPVKTGSFVGRVRLKINGEKPLPDLSKVQLPAGKIIDESLVFSKEGGLANVFVYLWKPKFQIPQPIARDNSKPFVLIANGEKFWPHAALVRVGRPLVVENTHEEHSNIRTEAIKNDPWNYGLPPQQRVKPPAYQRADTFPTQVKSDVHPWMLAYLFALDHPFAAVTDEQGRFTIEGMPPGEHEFRVWQERVGWLEKSLKITIKPDEQAKSELEYAPDRFKLTEADMLAWDKRLINAQRGVPQALEPRPAAQEPKKDEQK